MHKSSRIGSVFPPPRGQTRVWPEEELEKRVDVHKPLSNEETEAQVSRWEAEAHLLHLWGR